MENKLNLIQGVNNISFLSATVGLPVIVLIVKTYFYIQDQLNEAT